MPDVKKIATREAFGMALAELGEKIPNLVVLNADLAEATRTSLFEKRFPERHIDCGIAEADMMGIAAGLSLSGMIPVASSFAMFAAGRAFEQVRNSIGYPHLNVKIGATHAGVTVGEDGASHQCNEDLALMRSIPGMVVLNPADAVEAGFCLEAAVRYQGPVYMRFGRSPAPVIFNREDYRYEMGKGVLLRPGRDVTIAATGMEVAPCLEAAGRLAEDGIDAEVIDIHALKPLDGDLLERSARKTGRMVTAEEHSVIGGLGGAVCEALAERYPVPVCRIGVRDVFGESGSAAELLKAYGLDSAGIYQTVRAFCRK